MGEATAIADAVEQKSDDKKKPVRVFKIGAVEAQAWLNDGEHGSYYSISPVKIYKDGKDFKASTSFKEADLLNVAKVLERASDWLAQQP